MLTKMKAVVIHAPMQFGVEEVPYPSCPARGLVLKVDACGLCGSDLRTLRSGHHRVTFPWTVGHEISGTVAELGAQYTGPYRAGDRLAVAPLAFCGECEFCTGGQYEFCENYKEIGQHWSGGFAEYMVLPEECLRLGTIRLMPEGLDPVLATIAEPASSCVHAQEKGGIGLGDTVVIMGTGPVGCIHICLARARGATRIVVVDPQASRLKMAEEFGPDHLIDASTTDVVAEVRRLTGGSGADVVITANPSPLAPVQAVEMAKKGGRILLFGGLSTAESKPGVDMNLVHYRGLHLIGTTIFGPRHHLLALKLLASGRIPGEKLVSHRFPLLEFEAGAKLALEGKALKAVFVP